MDDTNKPKDDTQQTPPVGGDQPVKPVAPADQPVPEPVVEEKPEEETPAEAPAEPEAKPEETPTV